MISIELNKKLDYEVYNDFRDFSIAGADFGVIIKEEHPDITPNNFKEYIDKYYLRNNREIKYSAFEINATLDKNSKTYFVAIEKYFGNNYSLENFTGYISIFNCNPRFLNDKSFQVFYKKMF